MDRQGVPDYLLFIGRRTSPDLQWPKSVQLSGSPSRTNDSALKTFSVLWPLRTLEWLDSCSKLTLSRLIQLISAGYTDPDWDDKNVTSYHPIFIWTLWTRTEGPALSKPRRMVKGVVKPLREPSLLVIFSGFAFLTSTGAQRGHPRYPERGLTLLRGSISRCIPGSWCVRSPYIFNPGFSRFDIRFVHAVISDQRIRHTNDLPCIRRVRKQFLITGHSCVENHFSFRIGIRSETCSVKNFTGFQY